MSAVLPEGPADESAELLIDRALKNNSGPACMTCSFQAEDMVVLDLLRRRLPDIPVLFLDTGYHFAETCAYRDRMASDWNLNLVNVLPSATVAEQEHTSGLLYVSDPTRCCGLRKVAPLMKALQKFDLWFTGLRREQSPTRAALKTIEEHTLPDGKRILKINALAGWKWPEVLRYVEQNRIEKLPLYEQGYTSIGCQPCTSLPLVPGDSRSGRWAGKKLECGIHTFSQPEEDRR